LQINAHPLAVVGKLRSIVIRRIEGEEKSTGGIIIPDSVKEKPQEGQLVAVGLGARDDPASSSQSISRPATEYFSASGQEQK
jgi:co-chaperonin GroES (HSP10)